mmetsp:Transcript_7661/g.9820  ORF Transcript_7661/g.9820 Transcript_7661/m.9820 type:complete len:564 (-) Transcript_7661:79-1770(-)
MTPTALKRRLSLLLYYYTVLAWTLVSVCGPYCVEAFSSGSSGSGMSGTCTNIHAFGGGAVSAAVTSNHGNVNHKSSLLSSRQRKSASALYMVSTNDKTSKIKEELQGGIVMEGSGDVMDFANVKAEDSRAEVALAEARRNYLESIVVGSEEVNGDDDDDRSGTAVHRLMGINDEVVAEVGYEIGDWIYKDPNFRGEEDVQACAALIRSRYNYLLPSSSSSSSSLGGKEGMDPVTNLDKERYDMILAKAYAESGEVTAAFAKTFYLGTKLMPEEAQKAIWAIYVWCRRTDEIVDAPRPGTQEEANAAMLKDLSSWEVRLERLWEHGEVVDVLDLPLLDVRCKYPTLEIAPFADMVRGMLMDLPDLGQERYDTWEELHLYCYRVAGTVGLMSMPVFGCDTARGFNEAIAREPALSLGVAFQITNILRDVGEDAVKRQRIYLPREDMARFGVTEEQIYNQKLDENYINLMKFEIARARKYYAIAQRGVEMLAEESRLPVQSSLDCYSQILDKIEENGYDSLTKRAYVGKWEKIFTIPFSWYRTQFDLYKMFPLPGDDADKYRRASD